MTSGDFNKLEDSSASIGHEQEDEQLIINNTLGNVADETDSIVNNEEEDYSNEKLLNNNNSPESISILNNNEVTYSLEKHIPINNSNDNINNNEDDEQKEKEMDNDKINNNSHIINNDEINNGGILLFSTTTTTPNKKIKNQDSFTLIYDQDNESELNENEFITSIGQSGFFTPFSQYIKKKNNNIYEMILENTEKIKINAQLHKSELLLTGAFLFCFVSLGIFIGSLGPTLIGFKKHLNKDEHQVGYFFSARGLGYFVGSLGCRFIDRVKNSNFVIGGSILLMSTALLLAPVSGNIWLTALLFCFCGMGGGLLDSGLNTLIVWVWKDKVNPFMQLLHFSFGVGAFLAPLLVSQMVERSLFFQYLILSIIMFSSFFTIFFLKPAKPYIAEDVHSNESGQLSKGEKRLRIEVIIGISLFLFFYVGAESGYGGWICTYSINNLNFSQETGALLNSMFWGTFTLSRLGGVFVSLVLSPQKMVVLDTLGCFFFAILIILFPGSSTVLWIGTAGLGISLASIFPTAFSLPQNINIPVTGEGTSYMVIGAVIGEVVIPWAIGMFQNFSQHSLPWIVLFSLILSLIVYIAINLRAIQVRAREKGQSVDFSFSNSIQLLNQVVNSPVPGVNDNSKNDPISNINQTINNLEKNQYI